MFRCFMLVPTRGDFGCECGRSQLTGRALSVLVTGVLILTLLAGAAAARAFTGTNGDDEITGTDDLAGDVIRTLGGRDTVNARGGDDFVDGGRGSDGGMDGPALFADSPDDKTDSNLDGNDAVQGGLGSDALHGFGGDDALTGGAGNDRIFAGEDRFDPMGNTVPTQKPGKDTVDGGRGNDLVFAADGRKDRIDRGRGRKDWVQFDRRLDIVARCETRNRDL